MNRCIILPLPVIIRNVRPYLKFCIGLIWIYIRFVRRVDGPAAAGLFYHETPSRIVHVTHRSNECVMDFNNYLNDRDWNQLDFLQLVFISILKIQSMILEHVHQHKYQSYNIIRMVIHWMNDLVGILFLRYLVSIWNTIQHSSFREWKEEFIQYLFDKAKQHIFIVKRELIKEEMKMEKVLSESLKDKTWNVTTTLPLIGKDRQGILSLLEKKSMKENSKWEKGMVSGTVYSGESNHTQFLNKVFSLYSLSNPLHTDLWPSLCQMEAEIVSMTAHLLNGDDRNVVGATTSGGTESIILAVRAHWKEFGIKRGIRFPEIICCTTAHAALDKACDMFHIRLIKIPCDPLSFQLSVKKVMRQISSNTILIYASAPCYPQGVIDPIEDLSKIALKYSIGLHVDCCLGGFILPFARMLNGYVIPPFDFKCPGVTSISADTHKYGYAHKGSSVILYRNKNLRRAQYFTYGKWTGGLYSTSTILGSRPGALIACTWSSLMTIGIEGYKTRAEEILAATRKIANEIQRMPGLHLLGGQPKAMIVCFSSASFNIYHVADLMTKKSWSLNSLQNPACLHLCVTLPTARNADSFIRDLSDALVAVKIEGGPAKTTDGTAAIYGMAGSMPKGPVNELLKVYNDVVLSC